MDNLGGFGWLLLLVGPLILMQRHLHREIQAVLLLVTRRMDIATVIFSLLFFPGILLHETSHYLTARLLGVDTGGFSLLPKVLPPTRGEPGRGARRLQLGYVETSSTDTLRDALIGSAPLIFGGLFVTFAGLSRLGMQLLWADLIQGDFQRAWASLQGMLGQSDFWLWLYLTFVVSSTMLPSASDRRAWLPIGLVLGLVLAASLLVGAGQWLLAHVAPLLNQGLLVLDTALGISLAVHVVVYLPTLLMRAGLSRLTGMRVV